MDILFSYLNSPENSQSINWLEEAEAAEECGFNSHSFSYDRFFEGRAEEAVSEIPEGDSTEVLYRGWLMHEDLYQSLEEALLFKNYRLKTPSHEYAETLLLPNYFENVEHMAIPAVWTEEPDIEEAWELAAPFRNEGLIIRDHMKSAKESWLEACFVPPKSAYKEFESICNELRDIRGENFSIGYVVRPFIPLKRLGVLWTGAPISEEYRLVFWNGELIMTEPYFDIGGFELPDFSCFEKLPTLIDSSFFVADVAVQESGELILIELNPGVCAGLPPQIHPIEFYEKIADN